MRPTLTTAERKEMTMLQHYLLRTGAPRGDIDREQRASRVARFCVLAKRYQRVHRPANRRTPA